MGLSEPQFVADEAAMRALGAQFAHSLSIGDVVLLDGPLGAGKTTFVRGVLQGLGYAEPVRSPTFNLIQVFETRPPIMHADLYRVASYQGIGIEDYLETHACLIEWPDRAVGLMDFDRAWRVSIAFDGDGRRVTTAPPK